MLSLAIKKSDFNSIEARAKTSDEGMGLGLFIANILLERTKGKLKVSNLQQIENHGKKRITGIKQSSSGRIWTKNMWNPHHLNLIYKTYNNKVNRYCKSKNINVFRKPKLLNIC